MANLQLNEASAVRWVSYGSFFFCSAMLVWQFADTPTAWVGWLLGTVVWGLAALRLFTADQERRLNEFTIRGAQSNRGGVGDRFNHPEDPTQPPTKEISR